MKYNLHIIFIFFLTNIITLHSQWFQQTLPVNGVINDLVFFNKDTGLAALDNSNFLRTTNGGTNWTVIANFRIRGLHKIDSITAYGSGAVNSKIYRTYDGGTTWDSVSPVGSLCTISFISRDTGWLSSLGGIYKTTNGGVTASLVYNQPPINCGRLTFLKQNYSGQYNGFFIDNAGFLFKTENSGLNWINIQNSLGGGFFNTIYFLNKDTGWAYFIYSLRPPEFIFTSNNGQSWITQYIDSNENATSEIYFDNFNDGWAGRSFNKIWATSNGGINWGVQDIPIIDGGQITFIDSLFGWVGRVGIARSTNGGGAITYVGTDNNNTSIPLSFTLLQNYPNPFNPETKIKFSIMIKSYVTMKIYDIVGNTVMNIYENENLQIGNYIVSLDFSKIKLSSGVYFYSLSALNNSNNTLFSGTKKMIYTK